MQRPSAALQSKKYEPDYTKSVSDHIKEVLCDNNFTIEI